MRQFNYRDSLWPEKQKQRDQPQPYRHSAVGRYARDDVEIEYGNDKQQNQVKTPENAL